MCCIFLLTFLLTFLLRFLLHFLLRQGYIFAALFADIFVDIFADIFAVAGDIFAAWLAADCGYRKWGIVLIVIWVSRHCKVQLIRLRHDVSMCVLLEFQGLQSCFLGECQPCFSGAQAEHLSNSSQRLLAVRAQLVLIPTMLFWESSWRFIVVLLVLRLYVFQIPGNAYARMGCSIKLTFLYKIC